MTFNPNHEDHNHDHEQNREREQDQRGPSPSGPATGSVPLSVWPCAQQPAISQRRGRYPQAAMAHPAKMLPALAATAIGDFTRPGELVLDPMCGIGTTLIEAIHLGRNAIGIECEPRWAHLTQTGIEGAQNHGAQGSAAVICGDARNAGALTDDEQVRGKVALLLTSPPYGAYTHGHTLTTRETGRPGICKTNHTYGRRQNNLARTNHDSLLTGFTDILTACTPLLRPDGIVAITARHSATTANSSTSPSKSGKPPKTQAWNQSNASSPCSAESTTTD